MVFVVMILVYLNFKFEGHMALPLLFCGLKAERFLDPRFKNFWCNQFV